MTFQLISVKADLKLTVGHAIHKYVEEINPDAIIHCAAYKAEDDKENCWGLNVDCTLHLDNAAKEIIAKFIYISTDYVFNGEGE